MPMTPKLKAEFTVECVGVCSWGRSVINCLETSIYYTELVRQAETGDADMWQADTLIRGPPVTSVLFFLFRRKAVNAVSDCRVHTSGFHACQLCLVYNGEWLTLKVFMSQTYVGCCKQVYGCLCVWRLACVRLKECILSGKEGNAWTVSNMMIHTCSDRLLSKAPSDMGCL